MKKIIFITYTHSMGGGAERILVNTVNELAQKGEYQVSVLEYAEYGIKKEAFDSRVNIMNPIVDMNNSSKAERLIKYFLVHLCPFLLRKIYIKEKFDVEISFNYQIPSFLTSSRKDVYNIQWNHGDIYALKKHPFKRFLQSRSFKKADRIVVISENTRNSVVDLFPKHAKKIRTIYNGTDLKTINSRANEPTDITLLENSMVFIGRLEKNKNPLRLLGYMERLLKEGVDVNLYLLGTGVQEKEVSDFIKEAKLEHKVFLLGYMSNPYPIIKQSAAVCLLSESEGFPTVFTEGMALGKPFISSPVGGTRELSDNGNCGIIINSYEEFKEAVIKAVIDRDSSEKMQNDCLERIKLFSLEKQMENIIDLIEEK